MNKLFYIIILFTLCSQHKVYAQFSSYSKYSNEESVAYQVEDLSSEEIKTYNSFVNGENGLSNEIALFIINAGRAHTNLQCAPATIIDFHLKPEITEEDSIPEALGACDVFIELINTTPKVIKEITFEFEFENNGTKVYDIKTGDQYCILKFRNLKGRTNSDKYSEIRKTIFDCYHVLSFPDASYKKLFYNKKANTIRLHSCLIKYNDGTTSNKVSIFDNGYSGTDKIFNDGPLKPLLDLMKKLKEEGKI
ncbi:MAG: hypothetical protein IKZ61_03435 [Prevotella sp.]|nr:hypothetical protein [Prevotella sp.]